VDLAEDEALARERALVDVERDRLVKQAPRREDARLAAAGRIEREAQARRELVRDRDEAAAASATEGLVVPAQTAVDREVAVELPGVLQERRHREGRDVRLEVRRVVL